MADDQGYGDVAHRGHAELLTPTLDQLARTAVRFERFYAAAPVCSPTRASCLTGRHPSRMGIRGANNGHMPAGELTLAEILHEEGYRTGHFGKWHLGTLTKTEDDSNRGGPMNVEHYAPPWEHGFEVCFSTEAKVPTFDPMVTPGRWAGGVGKNMAEGSPYGTAYWNERGERESANLEGDDSRLIVDRALPFIEGAVEEGRPFFAVIWFHAPHLPVVASEEHLAPYAELESRQRRHFLGCLTALDEQLGRLRTRLRELGVAEDTMLWYCSDNGPEGNDGLLGSTAGLRGRKRSLHEGGVRVPAYLEWPRRLPVPRAIEAPCVTSDYVPTVLAALDLEHDGRPMDGIDLLPLLDGVRNQRRAPIGFESRRQATWVEERFKLVTRDGEPAALFDLHEDPAESHDLAAERPELVLALQRDLAVWRASCAESAAGADYVK